MPKIDESATLALLAAVHGLTEALVQALALAAQPHGDRPGPWLDALQQTVERALYEAEAQGGDEADRQRLTDIALAYVEGAFTEFRLRARR